MLLNHECKPREAFEVDIQGCEVGVQTQGKIERARDDAIYRFTS